MAPSKVFYLVISYFIWELLYTITDVAFGGLSAAISPSPSDRQKAITSSNICQQIASTIVFVTVPVMIDLSAKGKVQISMRDVFFILGLIAGILGVGLFSLAGFTIKERIQQRQKQPGVREIIASVMHNRPLLLLMLSNLIVMFATVRNALSTYYYIDVLGYASLSIVIAAPAMLIAFLSYPLISRFKKHLNNKQILIMAYLTVAGINFVVFLIGLRYYATVKVMVPLLIGGQCLTALMSGTLNVLPTEMLTETTDYAEWKTGLRNEGIIFSLRNSTYKINGTISQGAAALILSIIGYTTATGDVHIPQPDAVKKGLWVAFSLIPVIMHLLGTIPLLFYDLVGEKRAHMLQELEARRSENEEIVNVDTNTEL